jgi:DNA-binding NtrC family response regulator
MDLVKKPFSVKKTTIINGTKIAFYISLMLCINLRGYKNLDRKVNILIIDAEELICWSLKHTLEKCAEYSVTCVYTSDDAFQNLISNHYDVVITELLLPDDNGAELLKKIKELADDIPVIVISAHLSEPVTYDSAKYDVFRCLNKPFEISDIMSGVVDAMEYKEKGFAAQNLQ